MAYNRFNNIGEWTDQALLDMAMVMLQTAREEQQKSRRKDKWLVDNATLKAIEERVESFGKPIFEIVRSA
jgi:hypothetical protein